MTFKADSVSIKTDEKSLVKDTDYTVESSTDSNGVTSIEIVFKSFINNKSFIEDAAGTYYKLPDGTYTSSGTAPEGATKYKKNSIEIKYDAVLNEKAELYTDSNDNTAKLTFSNNPNHEYKGIPEEGDNPGNPDKPGTSDESVMGETPESKTETYTTAIRIMKVDGESKALTGAGFTITGNGVKTVLVMKDTFTKDESADPAYYKLKDGTYTTTASTEETINKYESNEKYKKEVTSQEITKNDSTNVTGTVDDEGYLVFAGLGSGTYTIEETTVPDGYNKAPNKTVTISDNHATKAAAVDFSFTSSDAEFDNGAKVFKVKIENNKGVTLPTTGSIGSIIFYTVGTLLIAGGTVLLITKKRMSIKEK